MPKPQDELTAQIETAFRGVEAALRRGDPDTLAGRMPDRRDGSSPKKRVDTRKKKPVPAGNSG